MPGLFESVRNQNFFYLIKNTPFGYCYCNIQVSGFSSGCDIDKLPDDYIPCSRTDDIELPSHAVETVRQLFSKSTSNGFAIFSLVIFKSMI